MQRKLVLKILVIVMSFIGLAMLLPMAVALLYHEYGCAKSFLVCSVPLAILGMLGLSRLQEASFVENLRISDGFLVVGLTWIFMSAFGALPFVINGDIPNFIDAFFETASGFTTTGATILTEIETLNQGSLFWRSLTHWIGGMGILVLTIALLPKLGIGGQRLMNAESTGPIKGKTASTYLKSARSLYIIYIGITLAEFVALMIAGLSPFDSIIHTFGSVGTGGFSNYNASVAAFDSLPVEIVIGIFTIMCGVNFSLYAMFLGGDRKAFNNTEFKVYIGILIFSISFITFQIHDLRAAFFQVASIISTTGFATVDFDLWPAASKFVMMCLMFCGSCGGSTAGGIKVIRLVIMGKYIRSGMRAKLHPSSVYTTKLDSGKISEDVMMQSAGFIALYLIITVVCAVIITITGTDCLTSFAASLACISNIGPGFGGVGPTCNFAFFSAPIKVMLAILMIAGRLEIYTILLMFSPQNFWRKKHSSVA